MSYFKPTVCFLSLTFLSSVHATSPQALFNSLNPHSLSEAFAFYELYPEKDEGKKALDRAAKLLQCPLSMEIVSLAHQVNQLQGALSQLEEKDLALIEKISEQLPNRKLKGYAATTEKEMLELPAEEIDLGKGLILSQLGTLEEARKYSAALDLMAMQILARLPVNATPLEKIKETNRFIFDQMHFRFPPQSVYSENIDLYTFLPSVMDNHLGVCLGVTAMYLAIAQRIDLPLEIITPPGHIYIRYNEQGEHVNIETTARGIHMPDETYLGLKNFSLELRNIKEVIGMTHVNQASTYLYKGQYDLAAKAYEKALPYLQEDPLLKELLGYCYILLGKQEEGKALLKQVSQTAHSIAEDYLNNKVDASGIEAVFLQVDHTRESLWNKQKQLMEVLKKWPDFRDGLHQLAITYVQLNRIKDALAPLTHCFELDPKDLVTAYYLAVLHGQRMDFKKCWYYLKVAENAVDPNVDMPQALKELRHTLLHHCPENLALNDT